MNKALQDTRREKDLRKVHDLLVQAKMDIDLGMYEDAQAKMREGDLVLKNLNAMEALS